LHGHGYDPSCPSGHSKGYCISYKQAYDKQWNDLHPSVPTSTSNPPLTTEKPTTTTAPQPIATPDKSLQSGVVQQQQPATDSTPMESSPILGLLPSTTNGSPDNSVSPTDKSESGNRAEIDASNDAKGLHGHGYDPSCPSGHSAGFCLSM
jgi:hypothetical protein